jgi:hypothetical protein
VDGPVRRPGAAARCAVRPHAACSAPLLGSSYLLPAISSFTSSALRVLLVFLDELVVGGPARLEIRQLERVAVVLVSRQ